jgi:hypothetical protein
LLEGYQIGLESGDFEYASWSAFTYLYSGYFLGDNLAELEQKYQFYGQAIAGMNQETALRYNSIFHQATLNLLGRSERPCELEGDVCKISNLQPLQEENKDKTGLFFLHLNQSILFYLFAEYTQAKHHLQRTKENLDGGTACLPYVMFYFYDSLTYLSTIHQSLTTERQYQMQRVAANQKKMKKWANYAPMNDLHKFQLVEAEMYRVCDSTFTQVSIVQF